MWWKTCWKEKEILWQKEGDRREQWGEYDQNNYIYKTMKG